ncbi:hypothetical protein Tco_0624636 [Tanacetum coccineum]|uniref:Uncharacterized protein n=1 Tax=Tanacetum coccineum TaxID=301880 RepID=A0ABQ4WEJ0_9ASTR
MPAQVRIPDVTVENITYLSEEEEEDELCVCVTNAWQELMISRANNGIDESDVEEVLETLDDHTDDQKDKTLGRSFWFIPFIEQRKYRDIGYEQDYGEMRETTIVVNLEDGKDNSVSTAYYLGAVYSDHSLFYYVKLGMDDGPILLFNSIVNAGVDGFDKSNSRSEIYFLKEELWSCDEVIDKGDCSNEVVHKRTEILNKIHQSDNIQASEIDKMQDLRANRRDEM